MKLIALNGVILPSSILTYPQTSTASRILIPPKIINNWDINIYCMKGIMNFIIYEYSWISERLMQRYKMRMRQTTFRGIRVQSFIWKSIHCTSCARVANLSPLWLYLYKWFYPSEIDFICFSHTCATILNPGLCRKG